MTFVEMYVSIDCSGCEKKIRKALLNLEGVHDVDVDAVMQKVTVVGWVDQKKALKAVRKTGRRAELWPYPMNVGESFAYQINRPAAEYVQLQHQYPSHAQAITTIFNSAPPPRSSYNYWKHGYNDSSLHRKQRQSLAALSPWSHNSSGHRRVFDLHSRWREASYPSSVPRLPRQLGH